MPKIVDYMTNSRQNIYLALEDVEIDFVWDESDVLDFDKAWQDGLSLWDIARAFDRDPDEVLLLALDRIRKGFINKRKNGVYGNRMREGMTDYDLRISARTT